MMKVQHEGDGYIFLIMKWRCHEVMDSRAPEQIPLVTIIDSNSKFKPEEQNNSNWSTHQAGNFLLSQPTSLWYIWLCLSEQMDQLERCKIQRMELQDLLSIWKVFFFSPAIQNISDHPDPLFCTNRNIIWMRLISVRKIMITTGTGVNPGFNHYPRSGVD